MKLQAYEIYAIEKYLLEQDLISLEFYDEMLDHFTSSILDYKRRGNDFETAFILTRNAFIGIRFSRGFGFPKYAGIKAVEQERLEDLKRVFKSERVSAPLHLFRSKLWFFWLIVSVVFLVLAKVFGIFIVQLITTFIAFSLAAFILYYSWKAKIITNGTLVNWSKFVFSSLQKRKSAQLKPNIGLYILMKSLRPTLTLLPFLMLLFLNRYWTLDQELGWNSPSFATIAMIVYSLIILDCFISFKKEYDKINLEKA